VAEWQTQQTQNLPRITPREGSSPSSGTNQILRFSLRRIEVREAAEYGVIVKPTGDSVP
jgi:hypothetical protein